MYYNNFHDFSDFSTENKYEVLELNPHYSDRRFDKEQTVFGNKEEDLSYVYNDRLYQWDPEKSEKSWKKTINLNIPKKTCAFLESYLSFYYDQEIEIKHIVAGVNRNNGYPYWIAGYKIKEK